MTTKGPTAVQCRDGDQLRTAASDLLRASGYEPERANRLVRGAAQEGFAVPAVGAEAVEAGEDVEGVRDGHDDSLVRVRSVRRASRKTRSVSLPASAMAWS
ncbi:hypothetical protein FHG89_18725 [Micromonospora orduensis]|uniref:Uncharacterized protein n=1 Tax=Micromonospora orduensis TaxID=1420891 RepID=A0A5C4QNT9_9ACTN|nr:hypothetical protein FHG89_18725 [Micromonospora orduensis]